jgi:hypothetical protein
MKFLLLYLALILNFLPNAFANTNHDELSIIRSIDDQDLPPSYNDASEICLPDDFKEIDNFTVISDSRARDLFNKLEHNSSARNRVAGGKCSIRRSYIQRYLRNIGISSGRLYIKCPSNNGRLRMIDQVTRHRYTFSNFHDTNVISVQGVGYEVFDVQFQNGPVTLSRYLAQIEASQKLKPQRNRSSGDRGYCYWSIR